VTHPHDNPVRAELQSLDQRRADTLADALRPVALTDDTPTPETWRVVEPDGSVDVLQVQSIGGGVYIIRCDSLGREHVRAASSRCAVDRFAGQYLGAAEIRGPGEATTAEQLAAVLSGVVDIADAVEDEAHEQRARAVELCAFCRAAEEAEDQRLAAIIPARLAEAKRALRAGSRS